MRALIGGMLCAAATLPLASCDALSLLLPTTVTVRLVNNSEFPVEVKLYTSDTQEFLDFVLTELGDERNYTIPAGETVTFTEACDDLQAIVIDDADLQVLGGIGPEATSDELHDGDDFGCGDTITFTFSHSANILDFDVTDSVQPATSIVPF